MMKAAFLQKEPAKDRKARYELRECPKPSLQSKEYPPGSVLIRVTCVSICGSDFCGCHGNWRKHLDYLPRLVEKDICGGTGHEVLGVVEDVQRPYNPYFRKGLNVLALSPLYIKLVVREEFQKTCPEVDLSMMDDQGGFAEYFVTHAKACFLLPSPSESPRSPDSIWNPNWYVLAQPLATIYHAVYDPGRVELGGKNVALVGQGQNGLLMGKFLSQQSGAKRIIVLDLLKSRLAAAKKLNPKVQTILVETGDEMIPSTVEKVKNANDGQLVDVVFDMVGHQSTTVQLCSQLTKPYGTVRVFGLPPSADEPQFTITAADFSKNLTYRTCSAPKLCRFGHSVGLLEGDRSYERVAETLFTHTGDFSQFPELYEKAQSYDDDVIKVLVTFPTD